MEYLDVGDLLLFISAHKHLYQLGKYLYDQLKHQNISHIPMYNYQLLALKRIYDNIPQYPFYEINNDKIENFVPNLINIMAVVGYGKTRLGIACALSYYENYHVIIKIPSIKMINIWTDELKKLELYDKNPQNCQFLVVASNNKKHNDYWKSLIDNNKACDKIIITSYNMNLSWINKPVLYIFDEAHRTISISPECSAILLSATSISKNFKVHKIYNYHQLKLPMKCKYFIQYYSENDIIDISRKYKNPLMIVDSKQITQYKENNNPYINVWGGGGIKLLQRYGNSHNLLTIIGTDIVEGVNFNKTNLLILNCSLNSVRLGRVSQLLGRVLRHSNIHKQCAVLHISPRSTKDIIKTKISLYTLMNNFKDNDLPLCSSERIYQINEKINKMGFTINDLTIKELFWLFSNVNLSWDFNNFENESVLGIHNLLNLGFSIN